MWAYCRIWRKDEGQFYLWRPHSELAWWQSGVALCRPESVSFHRGWVPLEGSTNMDMCTDSFLTCWPCAWEPDLLLYISKLLKSHGNSYPLPVKPCAAHLLVSAILPASSPASWHATAVMASCPHLPFGSPTGQCSSPLWLSYYCPSDWPFQFFSCNSSLSLFLPFWSFCPFLLGFSSSCWLHTTLLKWCIFFPLPFYLKFTLLFLRFPTQPSGFYESSAASFFGSPPHITSPFLPSYQYTLDSPLQPVAPDSTVCYKPEYSGQGCKEEGDEVKSHKIVPTIVHRYKCHCKYEVWEARLLKGDH